MLAVVTAVFFAQLVRGRAEPVLRRRRRGGLAGGGVGAYAFFPHVRSRVTRFLDPAAGDNYQVNTRAGGVRQRRPAGPRPGEGRVKDVLPDAHADFVFAVMGEEFGMVVCLLVLCVFGFIVMRGLLRLLAEHDEFVILASAGLVTSFGLQAFVNMASSLHLIPTKGMTLPFVSYGGSSVLAVALGMGMLLALTRRAPARRTRVVRGPAVKPIVIAAGGTGGHFFPAEALAAELLARGQRVALMTDARAAARLPACSPGARCIVLRGAGHRRARPAPGCGAVLALAAGTLQARAHPARLQPSVVVGFGGYPTVAPVLAPALMRDPPPVVLHEQNAVLGRANRRLARRATRWRCVRRHRAACRPACRRRSPATRCAPASPRAARYVPPDEPIRLLVLGGSLGARVFSDAVPAALAALPAAMRARLRVVQQCRAEDLDRVAPPTPPAASPAELATFFPDVPARMAAAHLVIARAGASTVAELAVAGRPAMLVPLPGAIDDHQTANARRWRRPAAPGWWRNARSSAARTGSPRCWRCRRR